MIDELVQMQRMVEKFMQIKMPSEVVEKADNMVKSRIIAKGEIIVHVGDMPKDVSTIRGTCESSIHCFVSWNYTCFIK